MVTHAFVEAYSVLTRLPVPYHLSPESCSWLIEASFGPDMVIIILAIIEKEPTPYTVANLTTTGRSVKRVQAD